MQLSTKFQVSLDKILQKRLRKKIKRKRKKEKKKRKGKKGKAHFLITLKLHCLMLCTKCKMK